MEVKPFLVPILLLLNECCSLNQRKGGVSTKNVLLKDTTRRPEWGSNPRPLDPSKKVTEHSGKDSKMCRLANRAVWSGSTLFTSGHLSKTLRTYIQPHYNMPHYNMDFNIIWSCFGSQWLFYYCSIVNNLIITQSFFYEPQLLYNLKIEKFPFLQTVHFERYVSDVHRFSSNAHQFSSHENVPFIVKNL